MAIRTSIRGAERDPTQIGLIRRAVGRMKTVGDERGFDFFASLHGLALPVWCEHGTALFLPWHRAYLYYFELAMQTRLGPRFTEIAPQDPELAEVGLPWWDWTSDESHRDGIPDSYAQAEIDGEPNPLAATTIGSCPGGDPLFVGVWSAALVDAVRAQIPGAITDDGAPRTLRDPDAPDELPRRATVDDIVLRQSTYGTFSNSLEQVHNQVHGWVGGSMAVVPTSAYDPIFWSHHAMIDRLWYLWQIGDLGVDPPPALLNTVLAPFPMTVAETLDIERLGYDYAVELIA
jgi:tyrosinase